MISEEDYNKLAGVRASHLKVLFKSTPAHLRQKLSRGPDEDSDALRFGRALHCRILTPDAFESDWVVSPRFDRRTKVGKEAAEAFAALAAGKGVIDEGEAAAIEAMRSSVLDTSAGTLLGMCELREHVLTGEIAGLPAKCRLDAASAGGLLLDIKTCISASPYAFRKAACDFGYLLQMCFYRMIAEQNGIVDGATVMIACEKAAPYLVGLYAFTDEDMERMRPIVEQLVVDYYRCEDSHEWHGYDPQVRMLAMPSYAFEKGAE